MSTVYTNTSQRFAKLAQMNELVFHADDLANIWQINNKNTLYTTLKRYTQKGLLYRIYKGFYSLLPPEKIDPILLGTKSLPGFAYLSIETVLAEHGVILQSGQQITLISSKSDKFSIANHNYRSRKLNDKFLFNMTGISLHDAYYQASPERAVADMLYFNSHYYFDNKNLINWNKVEKIQKEIGYK